MFRTEVICGIEAVIDPNASPETLTPEQIEKMTPFTFYYYSKVKEVNPLVLDGNI
jgi:hypothetical protein